MKRLYDAGVSDCDGTVKEYEKRINFLSSKIIDMAIKIVPHGDITARDIINEGTRQRYIGINQAILLPLKLIEVEDKKISDYSCHEFDKLMLAWIALGSALESSMQIFLTTFKHNYDDNPAIKWEGFDRESVELEILGCLDKMREDSILINKHRKGLKKEIKRILKVKEEGISVENITLYDLITYFTKNVWKDDSLKEPLNIIRENRNVIHSFKDREVMNWNEFESSLQIYLLLLDKLISTMTSLEDIVNDIISDYYSEMSSY
jgi:hypothetical protein